MTIKLIVRLHITPISLKAKGRQANEVTMLSVCFLPFNFLNLWIDFHETWYERYVMGGHRLVRWKRHIIFSTEMMYGYRSSENVQLFKNVE
jgi:hypothetical protein